MKEIFYQEVNDMVKENGMVMMTEEEYWNLVGKKEQEVTRKEFLKLYDAALEMLKYWNGTDEKERFNHIYGHDYDVTIHWNGVYCNCSDGATAWNHIVSNIADVIDELGDEEE